LKKENAIDAWPNALTLALERLLPDED